MSTGKFSMAIRCGRSVNRQPTSKGTLPCAVFNVLAFTQDSMDPRLLDGDRFHRSVYLQLPAEGSVQQRFFQFVERGEFALVKGFEALGFFLKLFERDDDGALF